MLTKKNVFLSLDKSFYFHAEKNVDNQEAMNNIYFLNTRFNNHYNIS